MVFDVILDSTDQIVSFYGKVGYQFTIFLKTIANFAIRVKTYIRLHVSEISKTKEKENSEYVQYL